MCHTHSWPQYLGMPIPTIIADQQWLMFTSGDVFKYLQWMDLFSSEHAWAFSYTPDSISQAYIPKMRTLAHSQKESLNEWEDSLYYSPCSMSEILVTEQVTSGPWMLSQPRILGNLFNKRIYPERRYFRQSVATLWQVALDFFDCQSPLAVNHNHNDTTINLSLKQSHLSGAV